MMHYILIFLEYTLPGLVIAGFVVWFLREHSFSKKNSKCHKFQDSCCLPIVEKMAKFIIAKDTEVPFTNLCKDSKDLMSSNPSQIVLVQQGDGFLNNLTPDFTRILDDHLSASSALGSVLPERSNRSNRLSDKALIEKSLSICLDKNTPPPISPAPWPRFAST